MDTGHLYVVQVASSGPFAVGHTTMAVNRFAGLQMACPWPLRLRTLVAATKADVHALQDELEPHRLHGDWFRPDIEVCTRLNALPELSEYADIPAAFKAVFGVPFPPSFPDFVQGVESLANQVHTAFMLRHAPICTIYHKASGPMEFDMHIKARAAADVARAATTSSKTPVRAVCFYARDMDPASAEWRRWRLVRTAGECPGGCHVMLP